MDNVYKGTVWVRYVDDRDEKVVNKLAISKPGPRRPARLRPPEVPGGPQQGGE